MDINIIFPQPVLKHNLGRTLYQSELDIVNYHKNKTYKNVGNITSLNTKIFDDNFLEIKMVVEDTIDFYVKQIISPKDELSFYITQSWLNYTEPGEYHHQHEHPNSILSGVFYFNAEEEKDNITFYKSGYEQIYIESENWNLFNSKKWSIPIKTGDIILFPSYLSHMVETTASAGTRVSLAFNVFARGIFGRESGLTSLSIR